MKPQISRREVIRAGAIASAAAAAYPAVSLAGQSGSPAIPDRGPRLDLDLVKEFVIAAHARLDRVKDMLAAQPSLINATWDWGGGDWETGLGGASHMGAREIAEYLLAHGARMDVFCAAMLGKIDIVQAFLADDREVVNLKGPHGISLIRHAQAGKQEAVVDLLKRHGAATTL